MRSIIRITGPQTLSVCTQVLEPSPGAQIRNLKSAIRNSRIVAGQVHVNDALTVDARFYLFFAPHSYTGEPLAEIHLDASRAIVEALMQNLLAGGLRPAAPGEFTARAYLNGKLDLAQAEAVNEVISSSNQLQLEAAEKLLSGRLTKAAEEIRAALLDCLSLIEAGLDFSGEDIEFISAEQAAEQLTAIRANLEELLAGSIRYETLADLPAIGIAGAPNAGKSSLLNALLGWERSIVSHRPQTTRDVLTGVLTTARFQCVLFDCAGLIPAPDNVLDELAQRAAIEALQRCSATVFCIDATKPDISEDIAIRALIQPRSLVYVATKCDLLSREEQRHKMQELERTLHAGFLSTSVKTTSGLNELLGAMEKLVRHGAARRDAVGRAVPTIHSPYPQGPAGTAHPAITTAAQSETRSPRFEIDTVALTARHKQAVTEAIENVHQAVTEVKRGNEEVAVVMIRAACQAISEIEQQPIDEQVLDRIFSRFCIGK